MEGKKSNLQKRLKNIPQHQPPDLLWESIETKQLLRNQLSRLPDYTPVDSIWSNIENNLEKTIWVVWKTPLSIAASILVLVMATFWLHDTYDDQQYFVYTEEKINTELLSADWTVEEDTNDQINAFCQVQTIICTSSAFQELKEELLTLEAAKTELQTAIDLVGKNKELITQITKIELERSAVLKMMMSSNL